MFKNSYKQEVILLDKAWGLNKFFKNIGIKYYLEHFCKGLDEYKKNSSSYGPPDLNLEKCDQCGVKIPKNILIIAKIYGVNI
jgi:hypothetical protein